MKPTSAIFERLSHGQRGEGHFTFINSYMRISSNPFLTLHIKYHFEPNDFAKEAREPMARSRAEWSASERVAPSVTMTNRLFSFFAETEIYL